jgi:hypothetical protein
MYYLTKLLYVRFAALSDCPDDYNHSIQAKTELFKGTVRRGLWGSKVITIDRNLAFAAKMTIFKS